MALTSYNTVATILIVDELDDMLDNEYASKSISILLIILILKDKYAKVLPQFSNAIIIT